MRLSAYKRAIDQALELPDNIYDLKAYFQDRYSPRDRALTHILTIARLDTGALFDGELIRLYAYYEQKLEQKRELNAVDRKTDQQDSGKADYDDWDYRRSPIEDSTPVESTGDRNQVPAVREEQDGEDDDSSDVARKKAIAELRDWEARRQQKSKSSGLH